MRVNNNKTSKGPEAKTWSRPIPGQTLIQADAKGSSLKKENKMDKLSPMQAKKLAKEKMEKRTQKTLDKILENIPENDGIRQSCEDEMDRVAKLEKKGKKKKETHVTSILKGMIKEKEMEKKKKGTIKKKATLTRAQVEKITKAKTTKPTKKTAAMMEAVKKDATKTAIRKLCLCGCEGIPIGKKSRFLPGHDAKLKGMLLKAAASPRVGQANNAKKTLASFGWA